MVDTKQARWVYRVARNFCGLCIFFCFAELIFATSLRLGVVKQECSVIVRWRDFIIPSKLCY